MRNKIYNFVYLNTGNYISYNFLKTFYWAVLILPFFMAVMSISSIKLNGVSWRTLFPLVSIAVWSFLYWVFVLTIKNNHVKKSFELRFLVNGIVGVAISSLIWVFFASWNLVADIPFLKFNVFLWMIPIYILVSVLYIASIVIGVHNGIYAKMKVKGKTLATLSTSLSLAVALGILISHLLKDTASMKVQYIVVTIAVVVLIFVPILAHINFVQYFYCKKYSINCDENGYTTSFKLEPEKKQKSKEGFAQENKIKNKKNLFLKNLITLFCILVAFFVAFCITSFIKGFIQGIS